VGRNKHSGSWQEPVSARVALPFTPASLFEVLRIGASSDPSSYSHQDIAHWCERFWNQYADIDAPPEIERLMPVLADVETQWDLFLANTYSLPQLQTLDFATVRLPTEWFHDWLRQAEA
jgi:hypothetical protein